MSPLAHKIELEPTEEQEQFFKENCGLARYAYNWALRRWHAQYECRKKHISWLCEEHGIGVLSEQVVAPKRRKKGNKKGNEKGQSDGSNNDAKPRYKRHPEKVLLKKLAEKGVENPILPAAPSWIELSEQWTRYKWIQELTWADDLYADAALQSIKNLGVAFKNFYDRLKKGKTGRDTGFPKRKRRGIHDSYFAVPRQGGTTYSQNGVKHSIVDNDRRRIRLPKVGWVRMRETLRFSGTVKSVSISRQADKWFASILVEVESKVSGSETSKRRKWDMPAEQYGPLPDAGKDVGIDLGIKCALTLSDGTTYDSPRPLKLVLKKLRRAQRRLSKMRTAAQGKRPSKYDEKREEHARERHARKQQAYLLKLAAKKGCTVEEIQARHKKANEAKQEKRGGTPAPERGRCRLRDARNYQKQKEHVARLHYRVACQRRSWLHVVTTEIIRKYDVICIENLSVRGMMGNKKLARSIADVGMHEFRRQLEYKAGLYGRKVVIAGRFFPSSKLCASCGWKNEGLALKDREWTCANCGEVHDRDLNAARNLLAVGTGMHSADDKKTPVETGVRRSD